MRLDLLHLSGIMEVVYSITIIRKKDNGGKAGLRAFLQKLHIYVFNEIVGRMHKRIMK